MGCNCKKTADVMSKANGEESGLVPLKGIEKALHFLTRFIMVLGVILMLTIAIPFILIFLFIRFMIGKKVTFDLTKITRRKKK